MSFTCYRCAKCMFRVVEHINVDDRTVWYDYIYKCDGSCRKVLPPRRVSTPHNLDHETHNVQDGENTQNGDSDYRKFKINGKQGG